MRVNQAWADLVDEYERARDRIEELEAALKSVDALTQAPAQVDGLMAKIHDIAHQALEGGSK